MNTRDPIDRPVAFFDINEADSSSSAEFIQGNPDGLILKTLGEEFLQHLVTDLAKIGAASCVIYEKNGDCACGVVMSDWCQCLRHVPETVPPKQGTGTFSREGHCFNSCWRECSQVCIEQKRSVEIVCSGGMQLLSVPIQVHDQVLGALKISCGSPSLDHVQLSAIVENDQVRRASLEQARAGHLVISDEMIRVVKCHLSSSARLLGKLIETHLREQELRESEALMRLVIKHDPDGLAVFDKEMVFRACSDRFLEDYGLVEESVLGRTLDEALPDLPLRWREVHQRALQGHVERNEDDRYERADGSVSYLCWECRPWYSATGDIGGTVFYSEFTTERRLAELALHEAKDEAEQGRAELEAVLAHVNSGIIAFDMQERVVHANDKLAEIAGFESVSELLSDASFFEKNFRLFSYPDRRAFSVEERPLRKLFRGDPVENLVCYVQRVDSGLERVISFYGTPVCGVDGEIELGLLILDDISQHLEARLRLEQSEKMHRTLFEASPLGMFVICLNDAQVLNVNSAGCAMHGCEREEMLEMCIRDHICCESDASADFEHFAAAVLRGEQFSSLSFNRRKDGSLFPVEMFGTPVSYHGNRCALVLVKDITKRRKREKKERIMQERMEQTQRLESLGVLAGGIAHDFNNLLMAIMGHADLALMDLSPLVPAVADIKEIKVTSRRAADLCTQLLAYSGKGKLEEKSFSVSELVEEMVHMLKTCISKKCVLNLNLEKELPSIEGDPSQMRQIIMNFVLNASEAIGDQSGEIAVSTGTMICTEEYFESGYVLKPAAPGAYVTLEVSDNGEGMSTETLARIFEPFYTTKFSGRGLGLSAVIGIIRSHGGGLRVYSEQGCGTMFKVLFPAVEQETALAIPADGEPTVDSDWCGHGTVLLVDDEETVRAVCGRKLDLLGFDVLTAVNGKQGVEVYRQRHQEIDLVILDLTMPEMGGEEAFRELRSINPDVKVVLASGYAKVDVVSRFAGKEVAGFLRKPYTIVELATVLSGLLPGSS